MRVTLPTIRDAGPSVIDRMLCALRGHDETRELGEHGQPLALLYVCKRCGRRRVAASIDNTSPEERT